MNNELPSVTSTYFISLIKAWLQGTRTKQEILAETADVLQFPDPVNADVTYLLTAAAREMNEAFYIDIVEHINHADDTVPTRAGLIHHLNALLAQQIELQDLIDWATWYRSDDEQLSAGVFDDFTVEYFCLDFLPANEDIFSPKMCRRALEILQQVNAPLEEKIALVILPDPELEDLKHFLEQQAIQPPSAETTDGYLMWKFGMDNTSFPYIQDLRALAYHPEKIDALLKKIQLLT